MHLQKSRHQPFATKRWHFIYLRNWKINKNFLKMEPLQHPLSLCFVLSGSSQCKTFEWHMFNLHVVNSLVFITLVKLLVVIQVLITSFFCSFVFFGSGFCDFVSHSLAGEWQLLRMQQLYDYLLNKIKPKENGE